jgi:hypothetical protein
VEGSDETLPTLYIHTFVPLSVYPFVLEEAGSSKMFISNKVHGITSQKTTIFIFTALRTSDLKYIRRL